MGNNHLNIDIYSLVEITLIMQQIDPALHSPTFKALAVYCTIHT